MRRSVQASARSESLLQYRKHALNDGRILGYKAPGRAARRSSPVPGQGVNEEDKTLSGVINGDGSQPTEMFPGISNPSGTGAPGSDPASAAPADAVAATFTDATGNPWAQISASSHGTVEPGQLDGVSVLGGVTADDISHTGAGDGVPISASSHGRRPWQQTGRDDQ